MATKRHAGTIAKRIARKSYRGALRMSKRKLAKIYATKCGQTTFRTVLNQKRTRRRTNRRRRRR